jgi:hypothetical protein
MAAVFSGPMFERAASGLFESVYKKDGAHYNIFDAKGLAAIRQIFPEGQADEMNFCLFSTSGVHGNYNTIEKAERAFKKKKHEDWECDITFLIVQPRIVCLRYGNCRPESEADFAYLKKLRASSHKVVQKIGA